MKQFDGFLMAILAFVGVSATTNRETTLAAELDTSSEYSELHDIDKEFAREEMYYRRAYHYRMPMNDFTSAD